MPNAAESPALVARYLNLLGVPPREPGLAALTELVEAHLVRVPFENLSKLYRRRCFGMTGIPDLATFLDGIDRDHFGGTCYANNYHLHRLLKRLGYRVELCGADMSRPDVHLVNIVTLAGRRYLVDGGYGAPFLAPLPLDLREDLEIVLGPERYLLKPKDADGRSRMEMYREGRLKHTYTVNPAGRSIEGFRTVIEESFSDGATFMNALVIARFWPGRSVVLHNLTLVESDGTTFGVQRLARPADLPELIEERFGIAADITRGVLDGLALSRDAWE
jgi:arylamine N-acetyltransferase